MSERDFTRSITQAEIDAVAEESLKVTKRLREIFEENDDLPPAWAGGILGRIDGIEYEIRNR